MTQEKKQLLLKDLCARIPYDTLVQYNPGAYGKPEKCLLCGIDGEDIYLNVDSDPFEINDIRPYLRPMSSMTKEERLVYEQRFHDVGRSIDVIDADDVVSHIDWLLSHHFDYRGLIEKGLALEAPEGMYKNE